MRPNFRSPDFKNEILTCVLLFCNVLLVGVACRTKNKLTKKVSLKENETLVSKCLVPLVHVWQYIVYILHCTCKENSDNSSKKF